MASNEKLDTMHSCSDESPDHTIADDESKYMFPSSEVGIPLTKLQWAMTFVGYVHFKSLCHAIDSHKKELYNSLSLSLFLAAVDT
jgi:hypothetical protein